MFRALTFLGLLAAATPAAADVTGRYRLNDHETLTIEVDESGIARVAAEGANVYTLLDGSDGFVVTVEDGVTEVVRLSDLKAVLGNEIRRMLGAVPESPVQDLDGQWQTIGPATVEGRDGIEYRPPNEHLNAGERIVLSEEARLAPLGVAWSRALDLMPSFGRLFGPAANPTMGRLGEMMMTRAPLQLGAITLVSASFDDISPARFVPPAPPLSREQVAAMLEARWRSSEVEGAQ